MLEDERPTSRARHCACTEAYQMRTTMENNKYDFGIRRADAGNSRALYSIAAAKNMQLFEMS
jgi:hypothetical protein